MAIKTTQYQELLLAGCHVLIAPMEQSLPVLRPSPAAYSAMIVEGVSSNF